MISAYNVTTMAGMPKCVICTEKKTMYMWHSDVLDWCNAMWASKFQDTIVVAMSHSVSYIYLLALIPSGIDGFFVYVIGSSRELVDQEEE